MGIFKSPESKADFRSEEIYLLSTPGNSYCSLSLWRVVQESKLMHLDLIHGLFIT
jgi:hypothetical protein